MLEWSHWQASRKITGFYKSYNRKTIRPFLDISYAKKHKGRWRMAKGKKGVFFFSLYPYKDHLHLVNGQVFEVKMLLLSVYSLCVELTITTKLHIPLSLSYNPLSYIHTLSIFGSLTKMCAWYQVCRYSWMDFKRNIAHFFLQRLVQIRPHIAL